MAKYDMVRIWRGHVSLKRVWGLYLREMGVDVRKEQVLGLPVQMQLAQAPLRGGWPVGFGGRTHCSKGPLPRRHEVQGSGASSPLEK